MDFGDRSDDRWLEPVQLRFPTVNLANAAWGLLRGRPDGLFVATLLGDAVSPPEEEGDDGGDDDGCESDEDRPDERVHTACVGLPRVLEGVGLGNEVITTNIEARAPTTHSSTAREVLRHPWPLKKRGGCPTSGEKRKYRRENESEMKSKEGGRRERWMKKFRTPGPLISVSKPVPR